MGVFLWALPLHPLEVHEQDQELRSPGSCCHQLCVGGLHQRISSQEDMPGEGAPLREAIPVTYYAYILAGTAYYSTRKYVVVRELQRRQLQLGVLALRYHPGEFYAAAVELT